MPVLTNCPACGELLEWEPTPIDDVQYCDNHPQRMYPNVSSAGVVSAVFNPRVPGRLHDNRSG